MQDHFLFAAYLIFFAWLISKTPFFKGSGLTPAQLVIIFLLKVMAGIFYGWVGIYYASLAQKIDTDTWAYHYESLKETRLLLSNPKVFITSLLHNDYGDHYSAFLASENSWWNDLKGTFFVKILALFNVATNGNYYINVIFYSFLTLFGPVALFRVMQDVFPGRRLPVLLACFLIPSFIYWTSGLHKDGIIFLGLALVIYQVYFGLKEGRARVLRLLLIALGLMLVLALRNFLIIPVLPALAAWWLASRYKKWPPLAVFSSVYLAFIILFFAARLVSPRLDFPSAVVARQEAFLKLGGGSAVAVTKLEPTFGSFAVNLPQAFSLSTIRPYPADVRHLLSLAAAVEIGVFLLLFAAFLFWRRPGTTIHPFVLFCLFLSFSILLMIGYTVNVLGAIVRYRSVVLPLLIVPMVARTNWSRINKLLFENITNK